MQIARASLQRVISSISKLTLQGPRVLEECQVACQPPPGCRAPESLACALGDGQQREGALARASATAPEQAVDAWCLLDARVAAVCSQQLVWGPTGDGVQTQQMADEVMHAGVVQWLGALGTYVASTYMWLWQHAPQARVAERVCVQWVGASVGEVEAVPLLEALLLHSLPHCKVQVFLSCLLTILVSQ